MTSIAIAQWQGRVSPVLDAAGSILLVEVAADGERSRRAVALTADEPRRRAAELAATGARVLICGAVSWPLEMALRATGIELIPQTRGEVMEVLDAYLCGALDDKRFLMPGCGGRGWRRRYRGRHGGGR